MPEFPRAPADCEMWLGQRLAGRSFVAQVILSPDDEAALCHIVKEGIGRDRTQRGIRRFARDSPATFVCFMVWRALTTYAGGALWPSVLDALDLGPHLEGALGEAFLDGLAALALDVPDFESHFKYVAPILYHSGIPDSCVPSYYTHVVRYFYRNGLTSPEAVQLELDLLRQFEAERRQHQALIEELTSDLTGHEERCRHLVGRVRTGEDALLYLSDALGLDQEAADLVAQGDRMLHRWHEIEPWLRQDVAAQSSMVASALSERKIARSTIDGFGEQERTILSQSSLIGDIVALCAEEAGLTQLVQNRNSDLAASNELVDRLRVTALDGLGLDLRAFSRLCHENGSDALSLIDSLESEILFRQECAAGMIDLALGSGPPSQGHASAGTPIHVGARAHVGLWWVAAAISGAGTYLLWAAALAGPAAVGGAAFAVSVARALSLGRACRLENLERERRMGLLADAHRRISDTSLLLGISFGTDELISIDHVAALRELVETLDAKAACGAEVEQLSERLVWVRSRIKTLLSMIALTPVEEHTTSAEGVSIGRELPNYLSELLDRVERKKEAAESAEAAIVLDIDPRIRRMLLVIMHHLLLERLAHMRLGELGGGNPARGLEILRSSMQSREIACTLAQDLLGEDCRDPASSLPNPNDINAELQSLRRRLLEAQQAMEEAAVRLRDAHQTSMDRAGGLGGDEPVVRFLIYGGEAATRVLSASVDLYSRDIHQARHDAEFVPKEPQVTGPEDGLLLYARRCHEVWKQRIVPEDEGDAPEDEAGLDQERAALVFRWEKGHLAIALPSLRRSIEDVRGTPILTLALGDVENTYRMVAVRVGRGLCELEACEHPIPIPGDQLALSVAADGKSLFKRTLDLSAITRNPTLYSVSTGKPAKVLRSDESLWVILPPGWRAQRGIRVIQEQHLGGTWEGYLAQRITPTIQEGEITFRDADEAVCTFAVQEAAQADVSLRGTLASFTLNDELVYLGDPPRVVIPESTLRDSGQWILTVHQADGHSDEPRLMYAERLSASVAEGPEILLGELLAAKNAGAEYSLDGRIIRYWVRLSGPRRVTHFLTFYVMAHTEITFEPEIRAPLQAGSHPLVAEFWLPDEYWIDAQGEGVLSEYGYARIPVNDDVNVIECQLALGESRWRLRRSVPRIQVRLREVDKESVWQDRVQDCWLGDLVAMRDPVLEILAEGLDAPQGLEVSIALEPSGHRVPMALRRVADGAAFAAVSIGQFLDSLRASSVDASFALSLSTLAPDGRGRVLLVPPSAVLRVELHWKVFELESQVRMTEFGECIAEFRWTERGKPQNRVLAVRPRACPWQEPAYIEIADGESRVQFDMRAMGLLPGSYDLHFLERDPWFGSTPAAFEPGLPNCFVHSITLDGPFSIHSQTALSTHGMLSLVSKAHDMSADPGDPVALFAEEVCALDSVRHQPSDVTFSVLRANLSAPTASFRLSPGRAAATSAIYQGMSWWLELRWDEEMAEVSLPPGHHRKEGRSVRRTASVHPAHCPLLMKGITYSRPVQDLLLDIEGLSVHGSMSWDANGSSTCTILEKRWRCWHCGAVCESTNALHNTPDGKRCPSTHWIPLTRSVAAEILLCWKPFQAVLERLVAIGESAITEVAVDQSWDVFASRTDWHGLFRGPDTDELAWELFVHEHTILNKLAALT